MARQGVFNRNDNSVTSVPRSLQYLNHHHTFDTTYGQIVPFFHEQMYPGETMRVNVTNLLRSIPLKTPQISDVKIITRFYAVPNRLLWFGFEEYIDGVKSSDGTSANPALVEPYIVNFNNVVHQTTTFTTSKNYAFPKFSFGSVRFGNKNAFVQYAQGINPNLTDFSTVGIAQWFSWEGNASGNPFGSHSAESFSRAIFVPEVEAPAVSSDLCGYQFFPHELGDYLNAPLYTVSLGSDVSGRFSAYPFAAYQLCYSYGYRFPNVETRIDDYYEMKKVYDDRYFCEYPSWYQGFDIHSTVSGSAATYSIADSTVPPISKYLEYNDTSVVEDGYVVKANKDVNPSGIRGNTAALDENFADVAESSDPEAVFATSWENVEHFPLKSGANMSMQGMQWNSAGYLDFKDTRISLFRMRYAPWQSDRFVTANPWQQRGDEAQIPVSGTLTFEGLNLSSEFVGKSTTISVPGSSGDVWFSGRELSTIDPEIVNFKFGNGDGTASYGAMRLGSATNPDNNTTAFVQMDVGTEYGGTLYTTTRGVDATYTPEGTVKTTGVGTGVVSGLYVSPSNFRFAMQLQKLKEMSAQTDGRFKSFLTKFYGSKSRDSRLDRPEFIGGSVQRLNISEVIQTTPTDTSALGSMAGRGMSAKRSHQIAYHATEHTVIIGMMHIIPETEYVGGLTRTDHYTDPFDWAMPQFAGLSEQPIRMAELAFRPTRFASLNNDLNDVTFGFEPRYNELRAKHSYVTGAFRDIMNTTGSYEYYRPWVVTRNFGFDPEFTITSHNSVFSQSPVGYAVPTLTKDFVSMRHNVDLSNFEVTNEDVMYPFMCDSYFDVRWTRCVPTRGVPRL